MPSRTHPTLRTSLVVLALVAAFCLGSAGPAAAVGLTPRAVKKIAAKVVAKAAPSLSVGHAATASAADTATTAGSAATLGGATAAQLRTTGYRYRVQQATAVDSIAFALPEVPAGTYLLAYSIAVGHSPGSDIRTVCSVTSATSGQPSAVSGAVPGVAQQALTATGIVQVTGATTVGCATVGDDFVVYQGSSISLVPIDTLVEGSLAPRS